MLGIPGVGTLVNTLVWLQEVSFQYSLYTKPNCKAVFNKLISYYSNHHDSTDVMNNILVCVAYVLSSHTNAMDTMEGSITKSTSKLPLFFQKEIKHLAF